MSVKKKKKNQQAFLLKSTSVLYWMLIEDVLDYAEVSGLVNLYQSGQARLVVRWGSGVEYHHFFFFLLQALIAYHMRAQHMCIKVNFCI